MSRLFNKISSNLSKIIQETKTRENIHFVLTPMWTFDDGFHYEYKGDGLILEILYYNKPAGLLGFHIQNDILNIDFVQGIKNALLPREWYNLLTGLLLKASLPELTNENGEINPKKIKFLGLEAIERQIKSYDEILSDKTILESYRQHLLRELEDDLKIFRLYKKIRDRWFDKEGYLNLKRKKVLMIKNPKKRFHEFIREHVK